MCPSLLSHYKGVMRMKTLEIRTDILIKVFLTVILIFGLTDMSFSGSPGTYRKQIYEVALKKSPIG
jgi:hypothetical protein